jgi:hypothetical protein
MPVAVLTAAADGAKVVDAPNAYQFIRVIGGKLTLSGAGTVSLKSDTTVIWNDISPAPIPTDLNNTIDCANGKQLNVAASAGTVTGWVEYVVQGRPDTALAPLP